LWDAHRSSEKYGADNIKYDTKGRQQPSRRRSLLVRVKISNRIARNT